MISISIILAVLIVLLTYYCIIKYKNVWQYMDKFPGPFAYPIVGNALQIIFNSQGYLKTIFNWTKQYNFETFRVYIGSEYYIVLTDPSEVETVLSSTTLLNKGGVYRFFDNWLGKGLLTSTGTKWFKHRKLITPSFHFQILPHFLNVINKSTEKFIHILKVNAKNGKEFDIQTIMHKLTLDIICEATMGVPINSLDNANSELGDSFYAIGKILTDRVFNPIKQTNFGYALTPGYWQEMKALKVLKKCIFDVITNRRHYLQNNKNILDDKSQDESTIKTKKPFLDNLLTGTIDGVHLTDQEIFEEVSTFMFEGHDTTASAISFAIYNCSIYPDIQAKLYEEQVRIFENDFNRDSTYQDIADMKYLEQYIKEVLRIYPSVPFIIRSPSQMIELGGKKIPPNTEIVIFLYAMGYNEKYFKDANKIIPERYEKSNREGCNIFDAVPFSAGPRNCIGQKFAMMEMKSTLSKLIRHYEILPTEKSYEPEISLIITLKSDNGLNIRLKSRDNLK